MDLFKKYESILEEIKSFNFVIGIFIFGSYLKNKNKKLSDLDIVVILSNNSNKDNRNLILSYGTDELDISIFDELPIILQYKIIKEGRIYYQKYNLNKFKRFIKHQYLDFIPYLEKAYNKRNYILKI